MNNRKKTAFDTRMEQSPETIKKFLQYIRTIAGKEENTVKTYYFDLKNFFVFISRKFSLVNNDVNDEYVIINSVTYEVLNKLTQTDILEYLYYCSNELNNSTSTRNKHLSVLKKYFNFLNGHEKLIDGNPTANIENPKRPKLLPKYLTLEQSKKLLNAVSNSDDDCDILPPPKRRGLLAQYIQ